MKHGLTAWSLCIAMLVATAPVAAAGFDGTWEASINQSRLIFELKAEGGKLTGTLFNSAATSASEIRDGRIQGDTFTFHVVRLLNGAEIKVQWTGKLAGDEIRFQRAATSGSSSADFIARRVKD